MTLGARATEACPRTAETAAERLSAVGDETGAEPGAEPGAEA